MGATPWYDDRRGQTYGVILFCTIVNFIALFAALMAGDDDPEVVKDFNLAVIQASSGEIRVGAAAAWLESCKRNGTATYGLLIPIILVKILAAFVVYRRAYAEHDTWRAKVAGVAVEAGCFVALLGITIEFYATCWRALPNRGKRMVFPGQPNEDKVQEVWVNVASVGICLAGLMSLVMSYLHFRTPCWNSELPEYGRD
ncbi:hypothetical protein JL722_5485 [Aureococcus anophagefferens]|nr:hypothetical protein JL722_5485 [Aureococcus anophagefferens]